MERYTTKIDVTKINKENIIARTYEKDGQTVTVKELELEIVPIKEPKEITRKDDRKLMKLGFISEKSTKNEDGTYTNGTILGDVLGWKNIEKLPDSNVEYPTGEEINIDDIPF